MRKKLSHRLLVGSAIWMCGGALPAHAAQIAAQAGAPQAIPAQAEAAQGQVTEAPSASPEPVTDNDIIVTARRRNESIQDVPQTIQAVTGEAIERQNLFQFQDLAKLVSGVTLEKAGFGGNATVRGVSFDPNLNTTATVSFYINDAPVQSVFLFNSQFDVGQVEVLKGPQGTFRGQSAPSGAITVTTRRPDLQEFGGTLSAAATDRDGRNIQGAVSIPLLRDVLAVRVAGVVDRTNFGGIRSVNSGVKPYQDTSAFRVSLAARPVDNLSIDLMYQNVFTDSGRFRGGAVIGNGSPGVVVRNAGYALPFTPVAGYNGPVLTSGQELSVNQSLEFNKNRQQFMDAQVTYSLLGQSLTYVGSHSTWHSRDTGAAADVGNLIEGDFPIILTDTRWSAWTHELRLSSNDRVFGFLDYVVGAFHQRLRQAPTHVDAANISFLPGAFGSPLGAPIPTAPNLAYAAVVTVDLDNRTQELSYFGNLTAHLGSSTELSGGVRFINAKKNQIRFTSVSSALNGRVLSDAACAAAGGTQGRTYAGVCDVPVAGRLISTIVDRFDRNQTVYNATLTHHFTPDILVYAGTGTSYRPAPAFGSLVNGRNDPTLASLSSPRDETTTSYEAGLKTAFLDRRMTLNVAYFNQRYENLIYGIPGAIPYLTDSGVGAPAVTNVNSPLVNVDAKVDGVDGEFRFAATERLNLGLNVSWANGRFTDQLIPCQDGNFDGVQDTITATVAQFQAAGVYIAQCKRSGSTAAVPRWNATLLADYSHPLTDTIDAFISGNANYQPRNPNRNVGYTVPAYALVDLQVGIRSEAAGWELQAFARNATNNRTVNTIGTTPVISGTLGGTFGATGYTAIGYNQPRELGLKFRYSFGSR